MNNIFISIKNEIESKGYEIVGYDFDRPWGGFLLINELESEKFINELISDLPQLKFAQFGLNNFEPIWGSNYYHYLSKTKMALNISRGKYQNKYSSDRISSLIGNGLLVMIDEKTKFGDFFNNNEIILYKNIQDLANKINEYSNNDKARKIIAKNGRDKYFKYFNSTIIADFIINKSFNKNKKNYYWEN